MISNISYRLMTFADYSNIRFNNDTVALFNSEFGDDLYNYSQVFDSNAMGPMVSGFALLPGTNNISPIITVFPGKLDIYVTANKKEGFDIEEQDVIVRKLYDYFQRIKNCFGDKLQEPNRLAFVTEYVYFDISDEDKAKFRDRFVNAPRIYKNKITDEVLVRIYGKDIKRINEIDEDINFITTVDRWFPGGGIGMTADVDGYRVELDLNTTPDNKRNRFALNAVGEFIDEMQELKSSLIREILDGCK